jgi:PilZ domain-containing protein
MPRDPRLMALAQPHSGFMRIACSEPCTISDADGARDGIVWNLSVVGAYIVVPTLPGEGRQVQISFSLPLDPAPIRAIARVVWENRPSLWPGCGERAVVLPPGFGMEFIGLDAADHTRIGARVAAAYPRSRRTPF